MYTYILSTNSVNRSSLNPVSISVVSVKCKSFFVSFMSLIELVTGKYGIQDLSGPVGTVEVISNAATAGTTAAERISSVLHLTIFITINVGIFNLLPIPGLDGSRFWFLFLEAIRRKPVKKEHEALVHLVGMAALFLLMIVVTVQDVTRIFH